MTDQERVLQTYPDARLYNDTDHYFVVIAADVRYLSDWYASPEDAWTDAWATLQKEILARLSA